MKIFVIKDSDSFNFYDLPGFSLEECFAQYCKTMLTCKSIRIQVIILQEILHRFNFLISEVIG